MKIKAQLENLEKLYSLMLEFIDEEKDMEESFQNLYNLISEQKINENKSELKTLLRLLVNLSNNHYRGKDFFEKIEKIIIEYKSNIQIHYSNTEIFDIFKSNKLLLLFMFEQKMITFDKYIFKMITTEDIDNDEFDQDYNQKVSKKLFRRVQYFQPEIEQFLKEDTKAMKEFKECFPKLLDKQLPEDFEEKRRKGENDDKICELIRNDLIGDFTTFVSYYNYPLKSKIKRSIYETNQLLLTQKCTLIEYAAFFGSCQIFRYLVDNGAEIEPEIWIHAVHSNSNEMLSLLEENITDYEERENDYYETFPFRDSVLESIKSHHNDVVNYVLNKYDDQITKQSDNRLLNLDLKTLVLSESVKYHNFPFFIDKIKDDNIIFYLCLYDYLPLVKTLLSTKRIIIESMIII